MSLLLLLSLGKETRKSEWAWDVCVLRPPGSEEQGRVPRVSCTLIVNPSSSAHLSQCGHLEGGTSQQCGIGKLFN